ncbi:hypothetical protein [Enterocloster citroniae]|uniref:Uncharacterized protein n=1 Tax=[Clostridium] citroniae WAL-17108 TaxID=742733 RepID=G5HEP0_9FIRM|nr:hypothetical protein [Enterocloster citroniae]EHE99998.1 hypothetical protein HMPREF9469_00913 [ [[Clostridium] citroniae WAL-17108]MCC3383260.1 hypothetical protein [Enterocloster citroniae]
MKECKYAEDTERGTYCSASGCGCDDPYVAICDIAARTDFMRENGLEEDDMRGSLIGIDAVGNPIYN